MFVSLAISISKARKDVVSVSSDTDSVTRYLFTEKGQQFKISDWNYMTIAFNMQIVDSCEILT